MPGDAGRAQGSSPACRVVIPPVKVRRRADEGQ